MPLNAVPAVRGTVAGHRLDAREGGGGTSPLFQCIPALGGAPHASPCLGVLCTCSIWEHPGRLPHPPPQPDAPRACAPAVVPFADGVSCRCYLQLLIDGDSRMIEGLFTDEDVLVWYTEEWRSLREHRRQFLTSRAVQKYLTEIKGIRRGPGRGGGKMEVRKISQFSATFSAILLEGVYSANCLRWPSEPSPIPPPLQPPPLLPLHCHPQSPLPSPTRQSSASSHGIFWLAVPVSRSDSNVRLPTVGKPAGMHSKGRDLRGGSRSG